jgi:hypothetical protein
MVLAVLALIFAALTLPFSASSAQQFATVKNPHTVTCSACRIVLDSLLTIGSANDSVLPAQIVGLVRDATGRFTGIGFDRFQLVVYDARGQIQRVFGRQGAGPGEFATPFGISRLALGAADTIYAVHAAARVAVISPSLTPVREFRLASAANSRFEALRDGRILTSYARSDSGFLLMSDANGRPIRWIGRGPYSIIDSLTFRRVDPLRYPQFRISGDQQSVWVMQENSIFRIQQWRLDGSPGLGFEFTNVPWMTPPHAEEMPPSRAGARPFRYMSYDYGFSLMTAEIDGVIWVRRWTRPQGSNSLDTRRMFLDAVDARTGRLLATRETGRFMEHLANTTDLAYSHSEDANGAITRTVWRFRLLRSG